ncbi:hypothetical protein C1H46_030385 [Malus baccata]|uniref:RING-type E3 ubiquitin transferase n=1 Tax=Malus baccata TaxID=106549 RepID=A0A540LC64_MALBA|nr:hypothetical protein C1H46_030385 [Malus baccata]
MENVGIRVEGASGSGSFFTPLLISMAGIVFTTLAIVAYHFLVKYCLRRRQQQMQLQIQASLAQQSGTNQSNGVDEKVLNSIPILSYSTNDGELFRVDQSECVICLGDLEDGDLVRLLPSCKHVFHNPCIERWFWGHTNCPVCRSATDVPIASVASTLPVEYSHDHVGQVRDRELEEAGPVYQPNCSSHPHDPEEGLAITAASTTISTQLSKPNRLLRHCVSLVVLPMEDSKSDDKPSSSSSTSSDCASSKPVLTQCRSLKARSMRQLDRMSSVLVKSISQLRMGQSFSTASGHGNLPC